MNLKIFDLLSMRFVLKIIFFFAFSVNFITPAVFAVTDDNQDIDPLLNGQDFTLDLHGDGHFSARYAKNKEYFAIAKAKNSTYALTKHCLILEKDKKPSVADDRKKLSDGGVIGSYDENFVIDHSLKFCVDAKKTINKDVSYGTSAKIKLSSDQSKKVSVSHSYIFLDTTYGKFHFGNYENAADSLKLDAASIATIDGGITNDWYLSAKVEGRHQQARFFSKGDNRNSRKKNVQRNFYVLPHLYSSYYREYIGGGYNIHSTYYSPTYNGLGFGMSYAKQSSVNLPFNANKSEKPSCYTDIVNVGAIYQGWYSNLKYKVSLIGEKSLSNKQKEDYFDLNGLSIGGIAEYAGFKFAGSFANVFKSGLAKNPVMDVYLTKSFNESTEMTKEIDPGNSAYYTLGASYEIGPAMASLTYFRSKTESLDKRTKAEHKNILNVASLGTHYHLSGKKYRFTPYLAFNYFKTEEGDLYTSAHTTEDNSGYVLLSGIKVAY